MSKKLFSTPCDLAQELLLDSVPYGVDSHAHLDSKQFDEDREEVLARAKACSIGHIGNIFLRPDEFVERAAYFVNHPQVFFILGIHPCDAMYCNDENLKLMQEHFAKEKRLKALGEIGLDFYWDKCPKNIQEQAFTAQLALAKHLHKPIVIHCRDAADATFAILEEQGFQGYPLLWHCFGSNINEAKRIIDNGWHISIPGPVSYPKNELLRQAVEYIPLDRIMLETDAPYLSPQQLRGKRNEPAYTVYTVQAMAQAKKMPAVELWKACAENAIHFFGLDSKL